MDVQYTSIRVTNPYISLLQYLITIFMMLEHSDLILYLCYYYYFIMMGIDDT